jgi:hypothetical protein
MGVNRRGLTWWLVGGLAAVFLGERAFGGFDVVRWTLLVSGAVVVFGATALRLRGWWKSEDDERRIERTFALAYLGCALAMVGLLVGTEDGVRWLGLEFEGIREELRFRRGFLVGSSILMVASLLPGLAAQWGVRPGGAERTMSLSIESLRVTQSAAASLSVALAGAFLVLAGYVAAENDWTFDASYFKTSNPGTAVQEIVGGLGEPLRVLLFFPEVDPVKDEVKRYFREMEVLTGNVVIEEYDRLAQPLAAEEHDVEVDGTILLKRGDRAEQLLLPTELRAARSQLRVFDGHVQRALLKLARNRLVAYVTVGHGELNDPFRADGAGQASGASSDPPLGALRRLLELLSYEVRNLGLQTGLGDRVPEDAACLMIIGPERPFLEEEMNVVKEYLDRGGSLLLALEPGSDFNMEPLREHLGVDFRAVTLADDQRHMRQRGGLADRRLIVTNMIAGHAAVTTAGRRGIGSGVLLAGAGHLVRAEDVEGPRTSFIIQAMSSTFADLDGDLQFDEGVESRGGFEVAAAVEGLRRAEGDGLRALVYADADMFSDPVLTSLEVNAALAADGIRWLAREESFAGDVGSEEDVPIVHTRAEDVAWFYAIIFGAPALVLGIGLAFLFLPRWGRRETAA